MTKNTNNKNNTQNNDENNQNDGNQNNWKDQQQKYMDSAKEMFNNFSNKMKMSFDKEAVMNSHKKNLEALNDASKMAIDVMKSITNLQTKFMNQTFEDFNKFLSDATTQKPTTFNMQTAQQNMANSFQNAMNHAKNVGDIIVNSAQQMQSKMKNRQEEGMQELKEQMSKYKH